jgi:hypothetical protein
VTSRFQYSVIRYVPNVVRDEAVNVGVLVRSVAYSTFAFKFLPRSSVVRRLWPSADQRLVSHLERGLRLTLKGTQGSLLEPERGLLARFGSPGAPDFISRARDEFNGNLQLTELRGFRSDSLETALKWIYSTYVEEPAGLARPVNYQAMAPLRTRERLWNAFEKRELIRPHGGAQKSMRLSGKHAPWTFDLGYQNGTLNLVNSLALNAPTAETNLGRALVYRGMIEDVRERRGAHGIAVASFPSKDRAATGADSAEALLKDANIEVIDALNLSRFVMRVQAELEAHASARPRVRPVTKRSA